MRCKSTRNTSLASWPTQLLATYNSNPPKAEIALRTARVPHFLVRTSKTDWSVIVTSPSFDVPFVMAGREKGFRSRNTGHDPTFGMGPEDAAADYFRVLLLAHPLNCLTPCPTPSTALKFLVTCGQLSACQAHRIEWAA